MFATGISSRSIAAGDFNGDQNPELAVGSYSTGDMSILLGDGTGSFALAGNFGSGKSYTSIAVGDFNGDARPDLVGLAFDSGVNLALNRSQSPVDLLDVHRWRLREVAYALDRPRGVLVMAASSSSSPAVRCKSSTA